MDKKLPKEVQQYFDRILLNAVKEEKEEEKRLGRKLTMEDRMKLAMRGCIRKGRLMQKIQENKDAIS